MRNQILILFLFFNTGIQVHAQWDQALKCRPQLEVEVALDIPMGVLKSVRINRTYGSKGQLLQSDTLGVQSFDTLGREVSYIGFTLGKRETIYRNEYPDSLTKVSYRKEIKSDGETQTTYTYAYQQDGYSVYYVTKANFKGAEKVIGQGFQDYDSKGTCIRNCFGGQMLDGTICYDVETRDSLVHKITQSREDGNDVIDIHDFVYNEDAQLVHYRLSKFSLSGDSVIEKSTYDYVYKNDRLSEARLKFASEYSVERLYIFTYNKDGQIKKLRRSIQAKCAETTCTYKDGKLIAAQTITDFPVGPDSANDFFSPAALKRETKKTTIDERWEYDERGNPISRTAWVDGVLRLKNELHLTYK